MQNWEGKPVFYYKIDSVETKFAMRNIITVTLITCVQKNSRIRSLVEQLLVKYRLFKKLPQISHIHQNCIFKSIIGIF